MFPASGSYTVVSVAAATTDPRFPADGKGLATTGTLASGAADASFVRFADESIITFVTCPSPSAGYHILKLYHGDGTLAAEYHGVGSSASAQDSFDVGPDGIRLTGNWYFLNTLSAGSTLGRWTIGFKVITGSVPR